jgi:hypothetical protein
MEIRYAQEILIGKSEGKKSSGRTRRRGDDTKLNLKEYVDWIEMAQNGVQWRAAMNIVVNFWIP